MVFARALSPATEARGACGLRACKAPCEVRRGRDAFVLPIQASRTPQRRAPGVFLSHRGQTRHGGACPCCRRVVCGCLANRAGRKRRRKPCRRREGNSLFRCTYRWWLARFKYYYVFFRTSYPTSEPHGTMHNLHPTLPGHAMLVRKARVIPLEEIVRGHISGPCGASAHSLRCRP